MRMKEDAYPVDSSGRPDLSYYTDPLDYYIDMHEQFLGTWAGKTGPGYEPDLAFNRQVHSTWGLIAKGTIAIPYALSLLRHSETDARADGASILAEFGRDDAIVSVLIETLKAETDDEARDSLILALGRLKAHKAIPVLAELIRSDATDVDTRWTAVESLGLIVRKRFLKQEDPVQAAIEWLDSHSAAESESNPSGS